MICWTKEQEELLRKIKKALLSGSFLSDEETVTKLRHKKARKAEQSKMKKDEVIKIKELNNYIQNEKRIYSDFKADLLLMVENIDKYIKSVQNAQDMDTVLQFGVQVKKELNNSKYIQK